MLITLDKTKKLKFGSSLVAALLLLLAGLLYLWMPKLAYEIIQEPAADKTQLPMELSYNQASKELNFMLKFIDSANYFEKAKLQRNTEFKTSWPFVSFSRNLDILVYDTDNEVAEMSVLYNISGSLSGIRAGEYRIRVLDINNNLIDEKYISISDAGELSY